MMRAVICKGDPTSHGGKVIEGDETSTFEGRAISSKGHMTYCPKCKGTYAIVEGMEFHSFFGEGTAVEDMKTACGAKLIATTTKGNMMLDDQPRSNLTPTSDASAPGLESGEDGPRLATDLYGQNGTQDSGYSRAPQALFQNHEYFAA